MKLKLLTALLLMVLFAPALLRAQNISGTINAYAKVSNVDFCNNLVALATISEAQQFSTGDKVLLIQMMGATISVLDDPTYGTISSYGDAGNYELLTVLSVNANIVTFQNTITKTYDVANGKVQLVSVPQYTNATVTATLTCLPWDGSKGGVLAFEASATLTLNADIDASGTGFSSGAIFNHPGCYGGGLGFTGYVCNSSGNCGGTKGNGIATALVDDVGRGAPANGGGGGNDHNTGGGGGANYADGGLGGQRLNDAGQCQGTNPGIGGHALTYSAGAGKVFMGGAGGNGDQNDNQGTLGANGGGIILISANNINGNGQSILNTGLSVATTAQQDGGGGGGGGGAVLLNVTSVTSALNVNISGGDGGDVDNGLSVDSCFGPGGGGGAGILWVNGGAVPANITPTSNGGQSGMTVNANANAACFNSSNGATAGTNSGSLTGLVIPESAVTYIPLTGNACCRDTICEGDAASLTANGTGTGGVTYNWDNGMTGSPISVSPTQTTNYVCNITDSRGCTVSDMVTITVNAVSVTVTANPTTITSGSSSVLAAQTANGISFNWWPTTGLNYPNVQNPVASPTVTTTYCCEITGPTGCLDTSCTTIIVIPDTTTPVPPVEYFIGIPNAFSPNGDGLNDLFQFSSIAPCDEVMDFKVFDRWGRWVNEFSPGFYWDGNDKFGNPLPMGVYTYYAQIKCDGEIKTYQGNVSLVR